MKFRTHITIEEETLIEATKDAKRLGLGMSAYVGLLISGELKKQKITKAYRGSTEVDFWTGSKAEYDALPYQEAGKYYIYTD